MATWVDETTSLARSAARLAERYSRADPETQAERMRSLRLDARDHGHVRVHARVRAPRSAKEAAVALRFAIRRGYDASGRLADGLVFGATDRTNAEYVLDEVHLGESAEQVYDAVARDAVAAALDGYNTAVVVLGQNGAGKTTTLFGSREALRPTDEALSGSLHEEAGLVPRAAREIFDALAAHSSSEMRGGLFLVTASFVEVSGERLTDLLADSAGPREQAPSPRQAQSRQVSSVSSPGAKLSVLECAQRGTYVHGANELIVLSEAELLALVRRGLAASEEREQADAKLGHAPAEFDGGGKGARGLRQCYRGHRVLSLCIRQLRSTEAARTLGGASSVLTLPASAAAANALVAASAFEDVRSEIRFALLADWVRVGGADVAEVPKLNQALSALAHVSANATGRRSSLADAQAAMEVAAAEEGQRSGTAGGAPPPFAPMRESVLTRLLAPALSGKAIATFVCALSPLGADSDAGARTLGMVAPLRAVASCARRAIVPDAAAAERALTKLARAHAALRVEAEALRQAAARPSNPSILHPPGRSPDAAGGMLVEGRSSPSHSPGLLVAHSRAGVVSAEAGARFKLPTRLLSATALGALAAKVADDFAFTLLRPGEAPRRASVYTLSPAVEAQLKELHALQRLTAEIGAVRVRALVEGWRQSELGRRRGAETQRRAVAVESLEVASAMDSEGGEGGTLSPSVRAARRALRAIKVEVEDAEDYLTGEYLTNGNLSAVSTYLRTLQPVNRAAELWSHSLEKRVLAAWRGCARQAATARAAAEVARRVATAGQDAASARRLELERALTPRLGNGWAADALGDGTVEAAAEGEGGARAGTVAALVAVGALRRQASPLAAAFGGAGRATMQESAGGLTVETGAHESGDGGGAPTPQAGPRRLWATAFAAATAAAALTAADEESLLRGSPPSPDGRSEAHKNPGGGARKFAGAAQLTLALGLARMSSSGEPSGLGARGGTPSVGAGLEEFRGRMESLGLGRDAFDALSASGVRAPYSVAGSHTSAAQREVLRDGLAERRHSFCLLDKCFHELRFHAQSNVRVYEARMVSRFAGRRRAPLSAAERVRAAIARQATPGAASPSASPSSAGRSPRGLGQAGGESAARLLVGRPPAVSAAPHEGPGLLANGYLPSPASVWLPSPAHNSGHASRARSPQQNGFLHELLSSPPTARVGMMLHNKEVATEAGWGSSAPGGRQLSGSDSELSDSDEDLRGVGKTGGLGARDARTLPPLADAPPPIPARGYSLDPKLSAAVTAAPERGTTAGMRPLIAAMSSPSSARQRNFMPAGGRPLDPGVGFPPPPP